jgi:hypothetical protein
MKHQCCQNSKGKWYALKTEMEMATMKKIFLALLLVICISSPLYAAQSTIVDVDGKACMGDDKSRKQTEQAAMADAKRRAAEFALTYLKSETQVKDFELEKDLLSAYSNAQVKIIQQLESSWYKDPSAGDCYKTKLKAEVIPDEKAMKSAAKDNADDLNAPLRVSLWTDKKEYKKGDKIKIYLKGNKPFYASVLYKDVKGAMLQLLPNPYRADNYFNGGVVYELPSGNDRYELEISPPFGEENIVVYACTSPVGELDLAAAGSVYQVKTKDAGEKTRAVNIKAKTDGKGAGAAEFYEGKAAVKTRN